METLITSITEGQKKQCKQFVEDAADKAFAEANLDKDSFQRVIENGDEFQSRVMTTIREFFMGDQFADEESNFADMYYHYPSGYKVKSIAEQVAILRQLFPELKDATSNESITARPLPPNIEGWFAIPRWEKIGLSYGEAVNRMLATIKSKRKFCNCLAGNTGPEYLRQHAKTVKAFQKLGDEQKDYDILIVPAQFGSRHHHRSVRRAREVMSAVEFGLGAFAVGCMLLTHPKREASWEQLHVDCAGDEFFRNIVDDFSATPVFRFNGNELLFGDYWCGYNSVDCGSASGFVCAYP